MRSPSRQTMLQRRRVPSSESVGFQTEDQKLLYLRLPGIRNIPGMKTAPAVPKLHAGAVSYLGNSESASRRSNTFVVTMPA